MQLADCSVTPWHLKGACCHLKPALSVPAALRGHWRPSPQSCGLSTCPPADACSTQRLLSRQAWPLCVCSSRGPTATSPTRQPQRGNEGPPTLAGQWSMRAAPPGAQSCAPCCAAWPRPAMTSTSAAVRPRHSSSVLCSRPRRRVTQVRQLPKNLNAGLTLASRHLDPHHCGTAR